MKYFLILCECWVSIVCKTLYVDGATGSDATTYAKMMLLILGHYRESVWDHE